MQHGAHERQVNSRHLQRARGTRALRRKLCAASGSATALAGIMGLASLSVLGCDGKDYTSVTPGAGGTGGAAGSAGSAGAGGNAGSAGAAQGGSAGAAGAAGSGGLGGTAGDGGSGGASGSSGGTDAGAPDADVPDGGDAAVALPPVPTTREEFAAAICQRFDQLADCEPAATCVDDQLGAMSTFDSFDIECSDEVDAFYSCLATSPVTSFTCSGDVPDVPFGATGCGAAEDAFLAGVFGADTSSCHN